MEYHVSSIPVFIDRLLLLFSITFTWYVHVIYLRQKFTDSNIKKTTEEGHGDEVQQHMQKYKRHAGTHILTG